MCDECIVEVKKQDLKNELEIRAALLRQLKVYNYVPQNVEDEYARALFEEYHKMSGKL
ncbi:hypothetical protein [Methanoregula sp.]